MISFFFSVSATFHAPPFSGYLLIKYERHPGKGGGEGQIMDRWTDWQIEFNKILELDQSKGLISVCGSFATKPPQGIAFHLTLIRFLGKQNITDLRFVTIINNESRFICWGVQEGPSLQQERL